MKTFWTERSSKDGYKRGVYSFIGDAEEFDLAGITIWVILVVAGEGEQVKTRMPGHCEGRRVQGDGDDPLAGGRVAHIDQQVFRARGQHRAVVAEAQRPHWPFQSG